MLIMTEHHPRHRVAAGRINKEDPLRYAFIARTRQRASILHDVADPVAVAARQFQSADSIWPDQCTRAIGLLAQVSEAISGVRASIQSPDVPFLAAPAKQAPLVELRHVEAQTGRLTEELYSLRELIHRSPSKAVLKGPTVARSLQDLSENIETSLLEVDQFLDVVRFQIKCD